jgi:integrase/recombinase XerD
MREYARTWTSFYGEAHGYALAPWDVTPTHAQQWVAELTPRLAPATVNKLVTIMCSYYKFAAGQFMTDGERLYSGSNPFDGEHLLRTISKFGRARYPTTDQVLAICDQIDTSSPVGLRDLCLIRGMFVTTRRLNEWLNLRWQDITGDTFVCRLKGGRDNRQILPDGLKGGIVAWLHAAGNYPPRPTDYIFVAPRFRGSDSYDWSRPLNPGNVWRIMRKYGAQAQVPPELCHPHGLRHAGARFRRAHGATAFELQQILGHRSIRTTEIYIDEVLKNPEDRLGNLVDDLFSRAQAQPSRALG